MHHRGELLCLVKPLFETEDMEARRTGVLPPEEYLPTLLELVRDVNALPETQAKQVTYSPVTGNSGTHEFFLHVVLGSDAPAPDLTAACERAVANVLALAPNIIRNKEFPYFIHSKQESRDHMEASMNALRERPVGIFDSGVGGISVLRELRTQLPQENVIYYGDTAYARWHQAPGGRHGPGAAGHG